MSKLVEKLKALLSFQHPCNTAMFNAEIRGWNKAIDHCIEAVEEHEIESTVAGPLDRKILTDENPGMINPYRERQKNLPTSPEPNWTGEGVDPEVLDTTRRIPRID